MRRTLRRFGLATAALTLLGVTACIDGEDPPLEEAQPETAPAAAPADGIEAITLGDPRERLSPEQIASGRRDASWRRFVALDTTGWNDTATAAEHWDSISPTTVNAQATVAPTTAEASGPSVLRVQVLLDRALFSPGIVDGNWGKNTEKALYWLQTREGLPATAHLDERTFQRLAELAGAPQEIVTSYTLTAEDVAGPFVTVPEDIYERAELDCMCYESVTERLAERFHTSPDLLAKLNPDVDLDALRDGASLYVPNVRADAAVPEADVASLRISDGGHFVHALDAGGRILFHFPSTLGSAYDPSPTGNLTVKSITEEPWWHYQPKLLEHVPDDEKDARIPPGPNSSVGIVWMALSEPHYGIHGTNAPETIGYAVSAGCVRLTNWDALFLSRRLAQGTPVSFTETE